MSRPPRPHGHPSDGGELCIGGTTYSPPLEGWQAQPDGVVTMTDQSSSTEGGRRSLTGW